MIFAPFEPNIQLHLVCLFATPFKSCCVVSVFKSSLVFCVILICKHHQVELGILVSSSRFIRSSFESIQIWMMMLLMIIDKIICVNQLVMFW